MVTIKYNNMEDNMDNSYTLIADAFSSYRSQLFNYIIYKIENREDAEDLVQDTFVRLLECGKMLRDDTVKSFIFTIANNLVVDYLRRYYKKQEIASYMMGSAISVVRSVESDVIAGDLRKHEVLKMSALPIQRKRVYYMSRFMDMSVDEISEKLSLSRRTVENHLFIGRKEVREYIKKCI